jgi:hypothetical protein
MPGMKQALAETLAADPQRKVQVARGMHLRRTKNGIPVLTLHYSADPERDPELTPEWKEIARKKYSSQAAWDREQEIVDLMYRKNKNPFQKEKRTDGPPWN